MHTLSNLSGGGGSAARKRPAASGGGSGGGGKRKAVGALQLGSEEGIGSSLLGAVSKKGGGVHHREDPAQAFLKAAAQSALAHHVEEVHANERFQAALGIPSEDPSALPSSGAASPWGYRIPSNSQELLDFQDLPPQKLIRT